MALSIVASFLAFHDFATPVNERNERVRTEWVSSQKITRKAIGYGAVRCPSASRAADVDYRYFESNYSRQLKSFFASLTPPRCDLKRFVPAKTMAGLAEPGHSLRG